MLVDLGRNDLGRVCEYGSVKVERLMFVERYSHVMHLVSALRGRLRADVDCFDALMACFPAGTLSGAPKVRAMEIIDELEPTRRGIYAGAILYLDFSGNLDSCIGLRTLVAKDGMAYVQAGAGLVADSVPIPRIPESVNKARAVIKALEIAHGGNDANRGELTRENFFIRDGKAAGKERGSLYEVLKARWKAIATLTIFAETFPVDAT